MVKWSRATKLTNLSNKYPSLQSQYRYIIFVLVFLLFFSFYAFFAEQPAKNLSCAFILATASYPWWRRLRQTPNLATYVLYAVSAFWAYEAWYRLNGSVTISYNYWSTKPIQPASIEMALFAASPMILLALVLLIDELFIPKPIRKYFYNIDMLNSKNLDRRKKDISKILADGNNIIFYSKGGVENAKESADHFNLSHSNILFYTEDEIDKQIKELTNIATLDKP